MTSNAPGWYGKLPMLGDFASRRLPQPFIDLCDGWLSRGIAASQAQLGNEWLNTYLTGPLWNFAWAPGVADEQWWFGVLMPSVDNVGRYFPLVVALTPSAAPCDGQTLRALEEMHARLGAAALANLGLHATLEDFEGALASTAPTALAGLAALPRVSAMPGRLRYEAVLRWAPLDWAQALSSIELAQRLAGHSLWWPALNSANEHSLSIARGLPPPDLFFELLQGSW